MLKLLKYKIKNYLYKSGWTIKKIYRNRSYTNQAPNEEVIKNIHKCRGIIHMGAHRGTEAAVYDWLNKKTLWIEADPEIFIDLKINISQFINQRAFNTVLYNKNDALIDFFISDNDGASSSLFKFGEKSRDLKMINKKKLKTTTLDSLLKKNLIDPQEYNFWVIDLQGAEFLALEGAKNSLKFCDSILIEISKDEHYINGAKWLDIKKFLNDNNFYNSIEPQKPHQDVLFLKKD